MNAKTANFLLKLFGWKHDNKTLPGGRGIILGAPHTSLWDFPIAYLYACSCGYKPHTMVKKEMFFFPMNLLMKAMGAIPTDRGKGALMLRNVISEFEKAKAEDREFVLCIAPEGTRKPVKRWKAGYHTIAKAADVPVFLGFFDWGTKTVGRGEQFDLTDDTKADTLRMQQTYASKGYKGRHNENYITE